MTAIELSHNEATTVMLALKRSFLATDDHREKCQRWAEDPIPGSISPTTWSEWASDAVAKLAEIERIVAKLPTYFHSVWEQEIAEARADRKADAA